jgi:hypothetical protein
LNPQNLYKSNIYKNVGTHGIEKITFRSNVKQRSINGYTMERGKAAYTFKMPRGFSVRQLQEIQRTPRSGSVMRVVQQVNDEGDQQVNDEGDPPTYNNVPITPPNMDFADRRAPVNLTSEQPLPQQQQQQQQQQEGNVADAGTYNPEIVNMVLQNRLAQVDLILQQQDDEINRRLENLRRDDPNDGGQYRNAEGQWVIEGGIAQDAQTMDDPFMLDQQVQLPVGPVQLDEIVQAQMKMRRPLRNIDPSPPNSPLKRQARIDDRKTDQKKQREDQFQSQRLSTDRVTGKRRRRTSSVGGDVIKYRRGADGDDDDNDFINAPPMVVNNNVGAARNTIVSNAPPVINAQFKVVKRKRQLSLSDQKHKSRKPRTDQGPSYTADRQVIANAPQRVRKNSQELNPAQGTRSKVKRT